MMVLRRHASLMGRRLSTVSAAARPSAAELTAILEQQQREAAAQTVPWFVEQMPEAYFRQVNAEAQRNHLRAITAVFSVQGSQSVPVPELALNDNAGLYTFLSKSLGASGHGTSRLEEQLASLPADAGLRRVLVFRSADGTLSLNMFETESADGGGEALFTGEGAQQQAIKQRLREYSAELSSGRYVDQPNHPPPSSLLSEAELGRHLTKCTERYVAAALPRLLYNQLLLYQSVAGTDDSAVAVEHEYQDPNQTLLTVALANCRPRPALQLSLALLEMHGLEVVRAQVDSVLDPMPEGRPGLPSQGVTLLRAVVRAGEEGEPAWAQLKSDLSAFKWLDDATLALAKAQPKLGLARAEAVSALADLSLSLLDHPLLSRNHVRSLLRKPALQPHVTALGDLFLQRFEPTVPLSAGSFDAACEAWEKGVEVGLMNEESRTLMRTMLRALRHTIRTNVHLPGRHALTLRLAPEFFEHVLPPSPAISNMPFGVFFAAGRHFNGFHVRFRDVSRGGLRVVLPATEEAHTAESRRHFNECFSLAWAQQLKNKDIPEGGSKAVCLVTPTPGIDREQLMHGCVKAFTDGLLDLLTPAALKRIAPRTVAAEAEAEDLVPDEDLAPQLPKELLYLGPDENITPTDINWVVDRAARRGYAMPSSFMSSKPDAGINHKEYGVTSEGVAVFLHEALRSLDIEPAEQPWTVKLTGGPDGDVAGNMLKILHREYGGMVRVVGMADGSGCAEDPQGLPMAELLRLFELGLPLRDLKLETLGPQGVFHCAETADGAAKRNSMHNRVQADVFVPAGGRPSSINGSNWRDFLLPDGSPSARAIVEGANLFVTAEARQALFEHCALPIIKDSSANKCGVICSSMEIVAGMLVNDDEFIKLKPDYVPEVLATLRVLARREAQLLFAEARRRPDVSMPQLSESISRAILRVTDATGAQLENFGPEQKGRLWPLTREHLPPPLYDGYASRIAGRLPWEYTKNMIACSLASRLVYREGLAYVSGIPDNTLPQVCLRYLQEEQRVRELAEEVGASGMENASSVRELLLQGGVRAAVERGM